MIQKRCTRNAVEKYQEMRRQEKHIHKAKKRSYTEELLKEIDSLNSQGESRKFYHLVNNMRQDFKPRIDGNNTSRNFLVKEMKWKYGAKSTVQESY
jgi:hypothetical protein